MWQVCTDKVDRVASYKVSVVVKGVPIIMELDKGASLPIITQATYKL